MTDVLFLGSKITVDGYCSHEIRRRLLLGRKAMTNLESVLKSRDITPWTQVCAIKAMLSPVVTHSCELDCEGSACLNIFLCVALTNPKRRPLDSFDKDDIHVGNLHF